MKNRNVECYSIIPSGKRIYGIADKTGEAGMSSGQNCSHEYRRAVLEPGMEKCKLVEVHHLEQKVLIMGGTRRRGSRAVRCPGYGVYDTGCSSGGS